MNIYAFMVDFEQKQKGVSFSIKDVEIVISTNIIAAQAQARKQIMAYPDIKESSIKIHPTKFALLTMNQLAEKIKPQLDTLIQESKARDIIIKMFEEK